MADSPWFVWPPTREWLRGLYWGGWTKAAIAKTYHRDVSEVDKLLRQHGLIPRPSVRLTTEPRIPRNNHDGDGYWEHCPKCRHKHMLCHPKPEGCGFGYVKRATQFNEHLLNLRDGHRCYSCGFAPRPFSGLPWKDNHLEMQHILPLSRGGSNCLHNLVWLCAPCHRKLAKGKVYGGIPERISPPKP